MTLTQLIADVKNNYNWVVEAIDPRHYPDPQDPNHPGFPDYRFYVHMNADRTAEQLFADRYQEYQVPVMTSGEPYKDFKMLVREDRTTGEVKIMTNDPAAVEAQHNPPPSFEDKMKAVQAQLKGAGKVDNVTSVHLDALGKNAIVMSIKDSGEAHTDPNEDNWGTTAYWSVWEKPNGSIGFRALPVDEVEKFLNLVKA